jgi:ketol-acid reductoisomerase
MAKIYYDADADLRILHDKTVAFIGYGSQGRHQALNMRDSGLSIIIAEQPDTPAWEKAKDDGFHVMSAEKAAEEGDMVILLVPDELHGEVYKKSIHQSMKEGKTLGVSHAFSVYYELVKPPRDVDVVMVAPKAPGPTLRKTFLDGFGVPACIAIQQDASGDAKKKALAWAKGIGATRAGVIETTFREEVETDHFGEIAVLCGGCAELIKAGFETLVEAGYQPQVAYFECLNELKLIVDLIYEGGLEHMWSFVSTTAEYGGRKHGKKIIDSHTKERMKELLGRIRTGEYANELIQEQKKGMPELRELRESDRRHQIEEVGRELRRMMGR